MKNKLGTPFIPLLLLILIAFFPGVGASIGEEYMTMVTGLNESEVGYTWINWTWTNPDDTAFDHTMVCINGTFRENTSNNYYNATGLTANTQYEIGTRTVDQAGNVNNTWVNDTAYTATVPANKPPVMDPIGNKSVAENSSLAFTLTATDPDNNDLTYGATGLPAGAQLNATTGLFTWTPNYEESGTYYVEFNVTDGVLNDSETVTIIVENVNRAPELASIGNKSVAENSSLAFTLTATDPDGDALTYNTNASFGTLDGNIFTWTPGYDDAGIYSVNFSVSDGKGAIDFEIVQITAGDVNRNPVLAGIGTQTTLENEELRIELSATDEDGDTLTFVKNETSVGALTDNVFTWTPGYDEEGSYSVNFSVSDGKGGLDFEIVQITVGDINRAPVLNGIGNQNVNEGTQLTITISANDPDGDALTYNTNASFGTLDGNVFTWTPGYDEAGNYSVNFSVSDSKGALDFEIVKITVEDVNRAPVLTGIGPKSTAENTELVIVLSATDEDGDTLTFSKNDSSVGTLTENVFTWTPGYDSEGTYLVNFSVSDSNGGIDFEIVQITVGDVNRNPVLDGIGPKSIAENEELRIELSATDEDGDALTFAKNDSSVGTLNDNIFTWTPGYDEAGTYSVNFSVSDGKGGIDFEIVQITVGDVNRNPVLEDIGPKSIAENTELVIELSATDEDGDTLTFVKNETSVGTLTDNVFTWTPGYDEEGTYSVNFSVSDDKGGLDFEIVQITVGDINRAPVLNEIGPRNVNEGTLLTINILANDQDGDTLTYNTNASFGILNENVFTWTPDYEDSGVYSVKFNVTDGELTDSEIVTITVNNVVTEKSPGGGGGSSGGGGGGGGGGGSPEPASNVRIKELAQQFITNGNRIRFEFIRKATIVDYVEFDAKKSVGKTTTIIEELKGISVLTPAEPEGDIYEHINIWVGNGGFATPQNIGSAVVGFRVNKTWIAENEITESTITLNRYSEDKWSSLQTRKLGEDEGFIYFEASTPGFSPFAVTAKNSKLVIEERKEEEEEKTEEPRTLREIEQPEETETQETEESPGEEETAGVSKSTMSKAFNFIIGFMVVILIGLAVIEKRRK